MHLPLRTLSASLALGLLAACTKPGPAPAPPTPSPESIQRPQTMPVRQKIKPLGGSHAFQPFLNLNPMAASTSPGGTVRFSAHINYDPEGPQYFRQPVDFRVEEAEGGTVTLGGLYTAPAQPGVYHVIARRQDFPISARATVTILAR